MQLTVNAETYSKLQRAQALLRHVVSSGLEFHHVVPFADGGKATVENIELRCRSHNQYEAERWFGTLQVNSRTDPIPH
jgi:5-methylcytosine-specific restriction endonuclease McrA